jgi:RHS repeat-associated protein
VSDAGRQAPGRSPVCLQQIDPRYLDEAAAKGALYAIVDGCAVPGIAEIARDHGQGTCLYLGAARATHGDKAPWLFAVREGERETLIASFGSVEWGCFLTSGEGHRRVRHHIRGMLTVRSPEGERWLFRFWDPRVLPAYLRASNERELNDFFGPISAFSAIDPAGRTLGAWRDNAIIAPPARRAVGAVLRISLHQAAALRRQGVAGNLAASFGAGRAEVSPAQDAVLAPAPGGGVLRLGLGATGLVDEVTSPLNRRWKIGAHEDGRLAALAMPSGCVLSIDYDLKKRPERVSRDGMERFRAGYDGIGRIERLDFPDGTSVCTDYARKGAAALSDADGTLVSARRDRIGRVERFAYEGNRLVAASDGAGQVTRFEYGVGPSPEVMHYADGRSERYSFDPAGRVVQIARPGGHMLDVTYDDAGRPIRFNASGEMPASFEYDEAGRLIAATNGEVKLAWVYDGAGRLVEERQGPKVIRHLYDAAGHAGIVYPSGDVVQWRRDADQRIVEVTDWSGARHVIDYADGDAGWRFSGADGVIESHWSDRTGLPVASRVEVAGATLWENAWSHDSEDRLIGRSDTRIGPAAWRYDAEGQVAAAVLGDGREERFTYDGAGNRIFGPGGAATFDSANRIVTHGGDSYRHDPAGGVIHRSGSSGQWRYRYDGFGRLIEATSSGDNSLTFGYDPLGRRVWKRARAGGTVTLTQFFWAGEQMISEIVTPEQDISDWQGAGRPASLKRDHCYWPMSFVPLLMRVQGVVYRSHTAPNGAPLRLTAPGGRVVWEAEHDTFGRAYIRISEVDQPLRLQGQYADDEFGFALHYNRFRYFDPATGRYLTPDPIGVAGGLNLYLYVGNNPLNNADPLGLWWKTALAVIAAVAVAAVVVITAPVTAPLALVVIGAGAAAGAAGFMVNEALNQEEFCLSCILVAGLKGALVGALAAVPFVFVPASAGIGVVAGTGGVSGLIGYSADVAMTPGAEWNMTDAAKAVAFGAVMGPVGRFIGSRLPIKRPYAQLEDPANVKPGGNFTPAQKRAIYEENMRRNNGVLRADDTGEVLVRPQKSQRGVTPPRNEAQIDHIDARNPASPNAARGTNSYGNARVISRETNQQKSNNPARNNRSIPPPPLPNEPKR